MPSGEPGERRAPTGSLLGQCLLVLLALVAIEGLYALFANEQDYLGGILNFAIPFKDLAGEQLRDGQVPLWSSMLGTGAPLFADSATLPLDPRNLLLLAFDSVDAYIVAFVGTRALSGALTFAYLRRRLGVSPWPAFVGALLFVSSTNMFEHAVTLSFGMMLLPGLLWLGERLYDELTAPRAVAMAAGWGAFLLTHSVGFLPFLLPACLAWPLCLGAFKPGFDRGRALRFSAVFGLALLLGALLAAAVLLPTLELATVSNRGGEYTSDPFAFRSLISAFVGASEVSVVFPPTTYLLYVGIISFAPILAVLGVARRDPHVPAAAVFGTATAALMLLGFLVKPLLVEVVPALASVSLIRPGFIVGFMAAILVAAGLDAPEWRFGTWSRRGLTMLFAVQASIVGAVAVGAAILAAMRLEVDASYEALRVLLDPLLPGILVLLLVVLRALGLGAALVAPGQGSELRLFGRGVRRAALVGVLLVAELVLAWGIARPVLKPDYRSDTPEVEYLQAVTGPDLRATEILPRPEWTGTLPGSGGTISLSENAPAVAGIPTPGFFGSLISGDYSETFDDFGDEQVREDFFGRAANAHMITSRFDSPLLRALGVGYLYSASRFPDPSLSAQALEGENYYVYAIKDPLPRAFFAGRAVSLPHDELHQRLRTLAAGDGDVKLGPEVLIEGSARTEGRPAYAPAKVVSDDGDSVEVSVDAPGTGYLVLSDVLLSGWTAEVDGTDAAIERANGFARAVRVGPGRHLVRFEYRPAGLGAGIAISLSALAVVVLVLLGSWLLPRLRARSGASHGEEPGRPLT